MTSWTARTLATLCLLAVGGCAIQAGPGGWPPGRRAGPAPAIGVVGVQLRFDSRYQHNHYYPAIGQVVVSVPVGAITVQFGSGSYYFGRGVWYRPTGTRFTVVLPPIGIVVPVLPPAYVGLRIGGLPYYYAGGVYYRPAPGGGYVVVAPPAGADQAPAEPVVPGPPAPVYYPRLGQSAAQTEADRRECNRWAATQPEAMGDAAVFQRAVAACMEGRGYTVR